MRRPPTFVRPDRLWVCPLTTLPFGSAKERDCFAHCGPTVEHEHLAGDGDGTVVPGRALFDRRQPERDAAGEPCLLCAREGVEEGSVDIAIEALEPGRSGVADPADKLDGEAHGVDQGV